MATMRNSQEPWQGVSEPTHTPSRQAAQGLPSSPRRSCRSRASRVGKRGAGGMRGNAVLQTKLPRHATEAMPGQIDKERNSSILTERLCGKISASSVYDIINSTHSDVQTGHRGFCRVTSHVSSPIISQMQKKITGSIRTIFRFQLLKYTFPKIETTVARATYLSSPLLARQRYHKSLDSFTFWKQCGASGRPQSRGIW